MTWAGDVPNSSAENEPEELGGGGKGGEGGEGEAASSAEDEPAESGSEGPAVVVLPQEELDGLFAGLDAAALEQQGGRGGAGRGAGAGAGADAGAWQVRARPRARPPFMLLHS